MQLKDFILRFIRYNHWANQTQTAWLLTLPNDIVYYPVKSSFTSIDLTLQHIKHAQNFWHAVITCQDLNQLNESIIHANFPQVVQDVLNGSQLMTQTYTTYHEKALTAPVSSPVMSMPRCDFMLHAINHNSYHRGQVVTIARSLGITENIPETDFDTFLWQSHAAEEQVP